VKTGWLPGVDSQGTVAALVMGEDSEVERQMAAFAAGWREGLGLWRGCRFIFAFSGLCFGWRGGL